MSVVVGLVLALLVGGMTTLVGLHRDRALYPVVMIVIALYYVLFAVMGGSTQVLVIEAAIAAVFVGFAVAGFKSTLWLVAVALAAHGIFDFVHAHLYVNPGVPAWWPSFCIAYDVMAAGFLAWLLVSERVSAHGAQ